MGNFGGMSDAAAFTVFGLGAVATVAILADTYTTMIGLEHGFVEGNPIQRWLFKKVGISFATFLGGTAVLFLGGFFSSYGAAPASTFFTVIAVAEAIQAFRNYRKLKAAKIGLK